MRKKIALLAVASLIAAPFAATGLAGKTYAASLTDVAVSLTNETAAGTTGATLTFTPVTAITTGTILEITYDTGFTGGASLLDADVTVSGTNVTSSVESNFAAGYFRSTLTTTGSVTTAVTVTIDNNPGLTNPAAGNYSWSVTADIGGAGTTYDSGAGLAYVGDQNDVNVSAVVPPVIDMELYVAGSDTLLANPNACALGVLSLAQVNTCTYDVGYGTNNASGMTVKVVRDAALDNGANDISDLADTAVTAGSEEYGFTISDIGTGCSASAASTYASQDNAVPAAAATFFSNTATCNGTTGGQAAKRAEVTHKASMDASTVVGSYAQVVTYTAFTN